VAVLDPNLVPTKLDVVIGDHYFELWFERELMGFDENGDEVDLNFQDGDDRDNENLEEEEGNDDQNFSRNAKRSKSDDIIFEINGNMGCNTGGAAANASMKVGNEDMEGKIKRLAEEIIDMVVNDRVWR
jgi:hypothetical protein